MAKTLIQINGYKTLVSKIRNEFEGLELLLKRETVLTYWRVGKYISQHLLDNKDRAGYGERLYEDLIRDTGRHKSTFTRAVQFYRAYPIVASRQQLNWTQYRQLITIKDKGERNKLEQQFIEKGLDTRSSQTFLNFRKIKLTAKEEPDKPVAPLKFTRGGLSCFRLLESEKLPSGEESGILIDLGFRMRRVLTEAESGNFKAGDCLEVTQKGKSYSFEKISISDEELFTYVAKVKKIIDGDTLWALIDCGFGRLIQQKLRLRGIDCPELGAPEGERAKKFVQERLKNLDFIVIKTYKDTVDKYDRYLVDLFYLSGEKDPQRVLEEGTFLNQELLDRGLAKEMRD